ncbi:MAG: toxin, partial [Planctomycetaceae bacterium]
HWRSITRDNLTTIYGRDPNSQIADPVQQSPPQPRRVFSWLICASYDDRGNAMVYEYAAENDAGVDRGHASERNRSPAGNRHIKRIRYGNRVSRLIEPDLGLAEWMFEVVFDYDEAYLESVAPDSDRLESEQHQFVLAADTPCRPWAVRPDSFSAYRAGFEVRTNRRCRRVLMFHHIPDLPTGEPGYDGLVSSTDFDYDDLPDSQAGDVTTELAHPGSTRFGSFLRGVTQAGYVCDMNQPLVIRDAIGYKTYLCKSLPPLEFEYSRAVIDDQIYEVDSGSLENIPVGLADGTCRWIDLHGEGLPGFLTEQGGAWFYKRNHSPLAAEKLGRSEARARFGPVELVASRPRAELSAGSGFVDLTGNGCADLVTPHATTPGFYEHDEGEGWHPFRPFNSRLERDLRSPNVRMVDLDGDGRADVLITEDEALLWHPSLGTAGFGPARPIERALDEEAGPRLVFSDGMQAVYLADMCGDGLTDLVRVRNGEVCYWPNLGYGRFGAKVTLDNSPQFDHPELFDQRRIRLADIDGSGTSDIRYLHRSGVHICFNQSGNRLSQPRILAQFPAVDQWASVTTADLLGNGTACLVWSSPLPGHARRSIRYVDLMGGIKPYLLIGSRNNLGAQTRISYAPSTRFYLADKLAGAPWNTRLPFPVHVVERVETLDHISHNRFLSRYAYHHGHYDGVEREFRGFGLVERWDTEEFGGSESGQPLTGGAGPTGDTSSPPGLAASVPPLLTRTWFHTGQFLRRGLVSRLFAGTAAGAGPLGYYREPGVTAGQAAAQSLEDTQFPAGLTREEEREASRALKGMLLRQEVYALDGSHREPHPYLVTESNYTLRLVQARGSNRHAVVFVHPRESQSWYYDRDPADPRTSHSLTLRVDPFGNVLQSATIAYGRRRADTALSPADQARQSQLHCIAIENRVTNAIEAAGDYRAPLAWESKSWELTGLLPQAGSHRIAFDEILEALAAATPLNFEQLPSPGLVEKRLIDQTRTGYRRNDLGEHLPFGVLESMALPGDTYRLAFTPGLIAGVYSDRVDAALLEFEGRYHRFEGESGWWIRSGQVFYSIDPTESAEAELAQARAHFFLPRRFRDPFHTATFSTELFVSYDPYDILPLETCDPLGNRVTAGERDIDPTQPLLSRGLDYRVLQPALVMDANRNCTAVAFDALGLVAGTAVMGKPEEIPRPGDRLTDSFATNLTTAELNQFLADPRGPNAAALLGDATTRIVYDLKAFHRSKSTAATQPAYAATLARETHASEPAPESGLTIQVRFSFSDGFGRVIQQKAPAEPGPVPLRDSAGKILVGTDGRPRETEQSVSPRWAGSGWTVFDNKGQPVRRYEPFFTDMHRFEFDVRLGVSSVLCYDPIGRVAATLHPNHSWEKQVATPWRIETWDVNDTVEIADPRADADVGAFFRALGISEFLPTWYSLRTDPAHQPLLAASYPRPSDRVSQREAAEQTRLHAATPMVSHLDSLGRAFLTVAHNRTQFSAATANDSVVEQRTHTRINLDIQGRQREVVDALGRIVMRSDYDLLGRTIHQSSLDAGGRWTLNDSLGRLILVWDSRGHRFRKQYDSLGRFVRSFVRGADPKNPGRELMTECQVFGELWPQAERGNLRGAIVLHCDQAGCLWQESRDFKGNPGRSRRRLAREYKQAIDWSAAAEFLLSSATAPLDIDALHAALEPLLEPEAYHSESTFDALNRIATSTLPDGSRFRPRYDQGSRLNGIDVNLRGEAQDNEPIWTQFVRDILYDAKGQRGRIDYGNGVSTRYVRDALTFRLSG